MILYLSAEDPIMMPSVSPSTQTKSPSKPFKISFGSQKAKAPLVSAPKKRPHSALAGPDSDHEEESREPQLVTAFDHSGAVVSNGASHIKVPLVIQVEKNRDWREESRRKRQKNLLPTEVQAAQVSGQNGYQQITHVERDEVSKASGIHFVQRDEDGDTTMSELEAAQRAPDHENQSPQTADEEAMEALLGGEKKKSTLQIPAISTNDSDDSTPFHPHYSDYNNEDERFRADVASRPEVATLDDYAAVPVSDFGSALLRGMGWKDGEAVGKRRAGVPAPKEQKIKERRPALLGIGAKETPNDVGDEFGAWGKAAKGRRKTDLTYQPVLLKNSKTGEMLTEEELRLKKAEQEKVEREEDWRERRDRNLRIDQERKVKRKENERLMIGDGRDGERNRDSDSKRKERERSAVEGRNGERSRHRDSRRRETSRERGNRRSDRSRDSDSKRRSRSREGTGNGKHSSRRRSRSRDRRETYASSRRERSRSDERGHRRR